MQYSVTVSLRVSGLTIDILSTFYDDVFIIQCVKLMLSKFLHLWFLLLQVYLAVLSIAKITCLKRFTRCIHRWGKTTARLAIIVS